MASDSGVSVVVRNAPLDRPAGGERTLQVEGVVGLRYFIAARLDDRQRDLLVDAEREEEPVIQRRAIILDQPDLAAMHALAVEGEAETRA